MPLRGIFRGHHHPSFFPRHLRPLMWSVSLRQLGNAFLAIVVPVFLYQQAERIPLIQSLFTEPWKNGLAAVLVFLLSTRLVATVITQPMSRLVCRLGMAHSMMIGQLLFLVHTALLAGIERWPMAYWVLPLVVGIKLHLYWMSFHIAFASELRPSDDGKEVGTLQFLLQLATGLSALLSGLVIITAGFTTAFLIGMGLYLVSALLLLHIPNVKSSYRWSWKEFLDALKKPSERNNLVGIGGFGWEETGIQVFWPLFLYVTFQNIITAGYILAGATLLALLLSYLAGATYRQKESRPLQVVSGVLLSSLWLVRAAFSHSPIALSLNDALDRVTAGIYTTLFYVIVIGRSRSHQIAAFFTNYLLTFHLTVIVGSGLALLLLAVNWSWTALFISFVIGGLLSTRLKASGRKQA